MTLSSGGRSISSRSPFSYVLNSVKWKWLSMSVAFNGTLNDQSSAEHCCMSIRRIRKTGSLTGTSTMRGAFRRDPASRAELMSLINMPS